MAKYYKAEDVERLIENVINVMIGKEEPMETALSDLPTIEITQCRDCKNRKHRVFEVAGEGICTEICLMFGKIIFNDSEFCNYGRKESDEQ